MAADALPDEAVVQVQGDGHGLGRQAPQQAGALDVREEERPRHTPPAMAPRHDMDRGGG